MQEDVTLSDGRHGVKLQSRPYLPGDSEVSFYWSLTLFTLSFNMYSISVTITGFFEMPCFLTTNMTSWVLKASFFIWLCRNTLEKL